jgi:hypothetical protein
VLVAFGRHTGAGAEIPSGQPVLTVRAAAATPGAVLLQLQELARKVRAVLEPI